MRNITLTKLAVYYILMISLIGWGYGIGKYQVFPSRMLDTFNSRNIIQVLFDIPTQYFATEKAYLVGKPFAKYAPKGYYLLVASMFDKNNAMRLIDSSGKVVKEWIFNSETLKDDKLNALRNILHGIMVLPDGSAMANLRGLFKLDKCGNLLWKAQRKDHPSTWTSEQSAYTGHHSIWATSRNTFWVPGREFLYEDLKTLKAPIMNDFLAEVSNEGEILRSISVSDIIFQNNLQGVLLINENRRGSYNEMPDLYDAIYVNNVKELSEELADAFPLFEAGDLLISVRYANTLMVVDPDTLQVKWYQAGPWHRQHDPDFQPDGTITLFNNNKDDAGGAIYGGSNIMKINPITRNVEILYSNANFYTNSAGEHHIFDDGKMLIVEAERGRVFMVDTNGEIVFEYTNPYDDDDNYRIYSADLIPEGYFTESLACEEE